MSQEASQMRLCGHICPSADRLYSAEANYQTFVLTNMHPQNRQFNGSENSPWYRLEGHGSITLQSPFRQLMLLLLSEQLVSPYLLKIFL